MAVRSGLPNGTARGMSGGNSAGARAAGVFAGRAGPPGPYGRLMPTKLPSFSRASAHRNAPTSGDS